MPILAALRLPEFSKELYGTSRGSRNTSLWREYFQGATSYHPRRRTMQDFVRQEFRKELRAYQLASLDGVTRDSNVGAQLALDAIRTLELNLHITQEIVDKQPAPDAKRRDAVKIQRAGLLDLPWHTTAHTAAKLAPDGKISIGDSTAHTTTKMLPVDKMPIGDDGEAKVNFSSVIDSDVTGKPTSSAFLNLETDASLGLGKRRDEDKFKLDTGRSLFHVASKEDRLPPQAGSLLVAHPLLDDGFLYRAVMLLLPDDDASFRHAVLINRRVIPLPRARFLLESISGTVTKTSWEKFMKVFNTSFISVGGHVLTMTMLHPYKEVAGSRPVLPDLYVNGDVDSAIELIETMRADPLEFRFFFGSYRWPRDIVQCHLSREIEDGLWFVIKEPQKEISNWIMPSHNLMEADVAWNSSYGDLSEHPTPSKLQLFRPRFSYPHAFDRVKSIDAQWSAVLRNCGGEYAEFAKWGRTEIPQHEGDGVLKI